MGRKIALGAVLALAMAGMSPLAAKTKADAGFAFPKDRPVKIILFRPDIEVGSLGTSGIATPNPDWTADARKFTEEALKDTLKGRNAELVSMPELSGDDSAYLAEYQSLFRAVGSSVMVHNYLIKLPSKKGPDGKYRFDWTLGPGTQKLGQLAGGNYGLFVFGYDAYATGGRKAFQMFALFASVALGGGFLPGGGQHYSYASLVDLDTGNIVWFNFYANKKGDVRTREGAQERADKLLSTLPGREGDAPPPKKKA